MVIGRSLRRDLVFPAVAAFQRGKIRIAKGIKDRDALVNELKNYRRKTNIATGNMAFEPWRESDHDDLSSLSAGLVGLAAEAPKLSAPGPWRRSAWLEPSVLGAVSSKFA